MAPTLLRRRGQQAVTSPDLPSKAAPMRMLGTREETRGDRPARATTSAGRLLGERPVGSREQTPFARLFYTPYWTTFELPPIDMKVASIGILGPIVAGLRWWSLRKSRGRSVVSGRTLIPSLHYWAGRTESPISTGKWLSISTQAERSGPSM